MTRWHKGWDASGDSSSPCLSWHSQRSSGEPNLRREEEEEGLSPLPPHQGTESQLCQQEGGYFSAGNIFPPPVNCQGISHPVSQFWKARISLPAPSLPTPVPRQAPSDAELQLEIIPITEARLSPVQLHE